MKYSLILKNTAFIIGLFSSFCSAAFNSSTTEHEADLSIEAIYHKLNHMPNTSMTKRIDWISKQFIGVPYVLGSLGEGPKALYDQFPQYRVDGFDCDTYVNTVVSLALASSLPSFQQCIKKMRYTKGKVSYIHRTHFTALDWNEYHQEEGSFKDITFTIKDKNNHSVALIAVAQIDKPNWYAHSTMKTIRLQHEDKIKQQQRLAELIEEGSKLQITDEKVPYLPLHALFPDTKNPDMYLFAQIPNASIIEIVRPNWDLRKEIGTALNISHLGFAIWNKDQLYFRQASSQYGKVVEVPLIEYLRNALNSPTIKGINVQIIVPNKPSTSKCKMPVSMQS